MMNLLDIYTALARERPDEPALIFEREPYVGIRLTWAQLAARGEELSLRLAADGLAPGASRLFVRRHDMLVGPPGSGAFEGAVQHVRNFGPVQRAEVALSGGETIEIDAPRNRELRAGDTVGLEPRRYRIFAG